MLCKLLASLCTLWKGNIAIWYHTEQCLKLAFVNFLRGITIYSYFNHKDVCTFIKIRHGIIKQCHGNYKDLRKNSIISLRLGFLEIPLKNIWVSWGVLFKGLGVQHPEALLAKTMILSSGTDPHLHTRSNYACVKVSHCWSSDNTDHTLTGSWFLVVMAGSCYHLANICGCLANC